jgi:hypothetical protein
MQFHLPDVFDVSEVSLYREKDKYLAHYLRLEKQQFLHAVLMEFRSQPELLQVVFITMNEGKDVDADLSFAPEFHIEEALNHFEAQSVENAMRSSYVPELDKFCDGRTIKRSDLLADDDTPRFPQLDALLEFIERA